MRLLPRSDSFDFMKISRFTQKKRQKSATYNTNRRVWIETRTDMESAPLETLETAVDLAVLILFDGRKSTKRDFSTHILVTPPDSPFRAAPTQPWRRVLRTTSPTWRIAFVLCKIVIYEHLWHPCEAWKSAKHSPKSDIMRKSTS